MFSRRSIVLAVTCVAVGAVAGPPVIAGASNLKEVLVVNATERAIPTREVGTTTVAGAVSLTGEAASALAAKLNGSPVGVRAVVTLPPDDTDHAESLYTVPAGKVLTVGSMDATVLGDMRAVSVEMICGRAEVLRWNGEIVSVDDEYKAAQWSGAHVAGPGCELHAFAIGRDRAFAVFALTGILRDAPAG